MVKRKFTNEETKLIKDGLAQGLSVKELAEMLDRTPKVIRQKIHSLEAAESKKVVSNTYLLNKIPPREIIQYLYELGYRIKNNKLILVQEVEVKLSDIISK